MTFICNKCKKDITRYPYFELEISQRNNSDCIVDRIMKKDICRSCYKDIENKINKWCDEK